MLESTGDYEIESILHIRNTLDEYERGYQTAIRMIEAGNSAEQIDSIVLEGKTILIADDNDINQMIVENMLEVTSANTILACNGIKAIEQFKKTAPDVILMDIQMPEMDGLEACLKIKALDEKIPIIALTANVMKEDIEKYRNAGFSGHLGKPFEINQLFKTLSSCLI